ncbi:MAG: tetratricopeptide repeat protein, partial [Planctomycetaceae bacterium]
KKPLNQQRAIELLQQAVQLDPSNTSAIHLLFRAVQPPDTIDPLTLRPVLDHWRQQVEQDSTSVQQRQHLIELLTVCGLFEEAIELLKPVSAATPDSQAKLARLFVLAGRTDEARGVTDSLLDQLRSGASDDERLLVSVVRVLLIENRRQEVVDLVETRFHIANGVAGEELTGIYVRSVSALFDQKAAADDAFIGTNESLDLLQRVYRIDPAAPAIAPRLAKVAVGQGVAAAEANALVSKILVQGTLNAVVYSAVGAEAILQHDFKKAVANLQQAHSLLPDDPVVLNNLAVALVRQSKDNAVRALDLVEQALSIAPGHPELLATRGEIYIALDRLNDARHDLSTVLNIDPQHELTLHLQAGIAD